MKSFLTFCLLLIIHTLAYSQVKDSLPSTDSVVINPAPKDSLVKPAPLGDSLIATSQKKDSLVKNMHSPRKATLRSTIIPGWGQIYNRKYWKVPLVYGAIGFPAYLFFDNKKWYNRSRYALSIVANERYGNADSLSKVHPQLRTLVDLKAQGSIINYRNEFRKNMDYSILFTLLMWGLNIVDATVDGHLKAFDVSDELGLKMKIRPSFIPGANVPGLALVVNFK